MGKHHSHGKPVGEEETQKETQKEIRGKSAQQGGEGGFSYGVVIWISVTVMVAAFAMTVAMLPAIVKFFELEAEFYKPQPSPALVRRLETEISRARWDPGEHAKRGELKMLWQTPVMNVNIAAMIGPADVGKFTERLAATIMQEYKKIPSTGLKAEKSRNQRFFEAQKLAGWKSLQGTSETKLLGEFFNMAVEKLLKGIGMPTREINARSKNLEIWASVRETGTTEVAKCFPDSMVTAVFFVKLAELSESLMFDDPRGPLPPFDNKLNTRPFIGDLYLFPSWLFHQVSTPKTGEEQITVVINVPGRWGATVGVSEEFMLGE